MKDFIRFIPFPDTVGGEFLGSEPDGPLPSSDVPSFDSLSHPLQFVSMALLRACSGAFHFKTLFLLTGQRNSCPSTECPRRGPAPESTQPRCREVPIMRHSHNSAREADIALSFRHSTLSASRWFATRRSSISGCDSSRRQSATRRFSPPDRLSILASQAEDAVSGDFHLRLSIRSRQRNDGSSSPACSRRQSPHPVQRTRRTPPRRRFWALDHITHAFFHSLTDRDRMDLRLPGEGSRSFSPSSTAFALGYFIDARHDLKQGRLCRHRSGLRTPIFAPGKNEREISLRICFFRGMILPNPVQGKDILRHVCGGYG